MISLNCPLKWLQYQLGHTLITTTLDLYGHLFTDAGYGSIEKFSNLLFDTKTVADIKSLQYHCNEENELSVKTDDTFSGMALKR